MGPNERIGYLRRLRGSTSQKLDSLQRAALVKTIHEQCRKISQCPWCGAANGAVKKVGLFKIVHERYPSKPSKAAVSKIPITISSSAVTVASNKALAIESQERFKRTFASAIDANAEIKVHLGKAQEDITALRAYQLFDRLSGEDCELLGLSFDEAHPRNFLWTTLPVPPACIRPSVAMSQEGGSNEDDLTVKLSEIVYTNSIIRDALEKGVTVPMLIEDWDFLSLQTALYIHSEMAGVPLAMQTPGKPIRGLCQRLKGKMGRFRGNLSGKRVDFSSRTVISPDPNLRINQIGVPIYVAKTLTYPEKVTRFNLEKMRQAVRNGPDVHPGANFVVTGTFGSGDGSSLGFKRFLRFGDRRKIAAELRVGDVVERHLRDGDVVLFNRQPSLHKLSIMAHQAVVRPWRTFRFNECACTPYNADFDGDEVNLHLPQTEEARAEALELMGVQHNLVTPRNGQPLVAAIQDFITAAHLITSRDVFMGRAQFQQYACAFGDSLVHIEVPPPAILKPSMRWTGKQLIGVMLRPNQNSTVRLNLELKGRTATKVPPGWAPELCPCDGYLIVRNSELLAGTLDKSSVGGDCKGSLFYVLMRDFGPMTAVDCMTRLAKLSARWLGNRGFSIGINDVQPGPRLMAEKAKLVAKGYAECDHNIEEFRKGRLETQAGCTAEQTLESSISGILSRIRDDCGQLCLQELSRHNAPLIMQWCGSKGSKINVSQMVACVGQQIISGSRIPDGFEDRSLPHFPKHSRIPAAKGFVQNSFYSGLTPTEFFFHAVSGREGLVDTAVKTAETGYMQRRLMKALEDLSVQYDMSVRNSTGGIVQFCYGDDGLDPASMEGEGAPVAFARTLIHARCLGDIDEVCSSTQGLSVNELEAELEKFGLLGTIDESVNIPTKFASLTSPTFAQSVADFINRSILSPMREAQAKYGPYTALNRLSLRQLQVFLDGCREKFEKARMEPGTAVGALGAQSIGEPGTQMTLKTFHFAGVASMNVTLGVPRIKEIINASKVISTPIITAPLDAAHSLAAARIVKGRIETTRLGEIAQYIEQVYSEDSCAIKVRLDLEAIQKLQLEVDVYSVERALAKAPRLKLGPIMVHAPDTVVITIPETSNNKNVKASTCSNSISASLGLDVPSKSPYFTLQQIKRVIPTIPIKGVTTVGRAVINDASGGSGKSYNLLVEGYGLREVMTTEGVRGIATTSNHVMEIERVLGIEAARSTIAHEIQYTMGKHGMTIDPRHVLLLADTMTSRGEVLGITRFGIARMKDSVLMLASFEKTTDHLFDAARFAKQDDIDGVSECIIMGVPMPVGTGLFKLVQLVGSGSKRNISDAQSVEESFIFRRNSLLFDRPEYHPSLLAH